MKEKGSGVRKFILLVAVDAVLFFGSLVLGIILGQGKGITESVNEQLFACYGINMAFIIGLFALAGLYKVQIKNVSMYEAVKILIVCALIGIVNIFFNLVLNWYSYEQIFVYMLIFTGLTGVSRFAGRFYLSTKTSYDKREKGSARALIIGAGDAGAQLSRELHNSSKINAIPVCFIDDDPNKQGQTVNGIKVVGTTADICDACYKAKIDEIYIAMPAAPKKRIKEILQECQLTKLPVKILPGTYQLINGDVQIQKIRPVGITDLLGREEVKVNIDEIIGYIRDEVVLVTGGGGSIGSELCRQIATHNPKQLIIFDIYENNAYDIEQELKRHCPKLNLLTLIGSIRDSGKLKDVFNKYHPTIVFNAAAHKHVPLMETSPNEAIKNNAIGTLKLARVADEYKVKTFVQISTDKAVNPTNIMGASKRICEMIIQTIGKHSKHTNFVAVRFGNVLGSNGSVIPLFKKQIEEGGPVTITHKDIIRYFMTIPEAVSLVLEAGAYAKKGQIFVLDMGEPVKIMDLALNLIKLSGLTPGVDIEIKETGLRPGEKLFEERLMAEEGLEKTANGMISVAKPIDIGDEDAFFKALDNLYDLAYSETDKMKDVVAQLVPTYKRKD